jgi:hypothetical protein
MAMCFALRLSESNLAIVRGRRTKAVAVFTAASAGGRRIGP